MFGKNLKRPPTKGDGSALDIQEIFPTLQGEGPYVGWPSIFIRLGGCNLACSFCDTEFESYASWTLESIMEKVKELRASNPCSLVVITGGEPLRQPLNQLCEELGILGLLVQIETNGTLFQPLPKHVELVCSPKNTGSGYHAIRPDIVQRINAFKFILSETLDGYQEIGEVGQSDHDIPVYIQPMDEQDKTKNAHNVAYAVAYAKKHGHRVSLQIHKILDIP